MIFLNKFMYLFNEGTKSIYRAILPSVVSSMTIAVSLVILSVSYIFYSNFFYYTSDFKNEYKIDVFFNNKLNLNESLNIFNEILLIDGVQEGVFIDKETASQIFKKEFNEDILNIIGENPLPMGAMFGVSDNYKNYDKISEITKKIKYLKDVDDAIFPEQAIVKFDRIIRNLLSFSFIIGVFIVVLSYFFVSNTILLVIHSKTNEINTMKLLGASDIFIKIPYIINGLLLGLIGSIVSCFVLFLIYKVSLYVILPYYELNNFNYQLISFLNIIVGCLLGVVGSSKALSSFVKSN